jgi:hypothetical protein
MARYFSIADGNLGEINAFGVSLSTAEVRNGTTVVPLLTSSLFSTPVFIGKNFIPSVSINLSSVNSNSTGNLNLNLKHIQNYNTIIDNSKSNSITTSPTNGGDKVMFSPFNLNGWSALFFPYFDNVDSIRNSTYISLPNPTTNLVLDANFTIETWVYFLSAGNGLQTIIQSDWSTGNNLALRFNDSTTLNKITFWASNNSSTVPFLTSTSSIDPFKWYHVAVTRDSNTFTLYINGNAEDTKTQAVTISRQLQFIGSTQTPNSYLSGYMSNLRVVKGQSLFTGNFTPPTSALALNSIGSTGNVVPLLTGTISLQTFQNNRFIDNSLSNLVLTNSLVRIKNVNPFNILTYDKNKEIGSILLNNATGNDSLYITHNNNLNFVGLTALTIEGWIYFTGKPNNGCLWKKGTIDAFLQISRVIMNTNGSGTVFFDQSTGFNLGEWNHYAMVLSGVNITTYINGKNAGTSSGISIANTGTGNIIIGGNRLPNNSSVFTESYLSNFRITKSIVYTNAFSLTSSEFLEPLKELPETCLLLNFNNFSDNNIETYPISSFTKFNGNDNTYSIYSQNWQTLKLTNQLSSYDNLMLDLKTNNNNDIILLGNSTNQLIDYTGYFPTISARSTISLSSVNLPNKNIENAIFFDGTNNWITIPASRNLVFAKDFTIEFWINTSTFSIDTTYRRVLSFGTNASNNLQLIFSNAAGSLSANTLMVFTNSVIISGTSVVADGNWHHVALSRENNHLKLFVDGIQSGNSYIAPLGIGEYTTAIYNAGSINALSIGTSGNTATGRLSGYIANLHIVRDRALYTTNFIASAQSLTATDNSILLLKTTTNYNKVIIGSVPVLSGSLTNIKNVSASSINSPFGSTLNGSLSFSGGNSLSGTADTNFGTGDFTVEGWFNARSLKETGILQTSDSNTGLKTTNTTGIWIRLAVTTSYIEANIGNTSINSTFAPTINTWYHFALTRQNGFARLFLNGQLLQSGAAATSINGTFFTIGNYYSVATYHWPGWLSNIRVIKGQSLYNTNFSVPTSPLSLTHYGTVLLMNSPHSLSSFSHNLSGSELLFTDVNIGGALSGSNTEVHTISAVTYTLSSLQIHNAGVLTFPYNKQTNITVSTPIGIQVTSGGTLNIGTSTLPISSSNTVNISGGLIHVHNGGNLNIYGAYRVPYSHLSIDAPAATGRFIANQSLSSTWLSGDNLVLTNNVSGLSTIDGLILSGFENDRIFRTTTNSVYRHTSLSSNPYIPSILNLTRNVSVNSVIYNNGYSNININNALFNNRLNILGTENPNISSSYILNNNVFNNCSNFLFGSNWSGYFNSNKISVPAGALFQYGTNPFTIETWVYLTSFSTDVQMFFAQTVAGTNYLYIGFTTSGLPEFKFGTSGGTSLGTSNIRCQLNRWYHIAVVREATSSTKLYINGIAAISGTCSFDFTNVSYAPTIGGYTHTAAANNWIGYISNFRIVKGQALYTGNFIPSTIPLTRTTNGNAIGNNVNPLSTNVSLLTLQNNTLIDNSVNINTVTTNGTTDITKFTPFLIKNNISYINNIFTKNSTQLNFNDLRGSNINITDNMFIANSAFITGLQLIGVSANNSTMSGNYVVGLTGIGTYIQDCSAGVGGTINFNGTNGVVVSGNNYGNISNIVSVSSRNNGIVIWNTNTNTIFKNITSNNNINGIVLSGNNLNYLTPAIINLNNIEANNNRDSGIEVYNIVGNLNNLTLNNNLSYGLKTSIGNGPLTINNVTSKMVSGVNIAFLSAINYDETVIANSYLSAITNYQNISTNGSILLNSSKLELLTLNNVQLRQITVLSSTGLVIGDYNLNNSIIGNSNISVLTATNYNTINVMKGEQISNNHYRLTPLGKISFDNLVYKTNAPSEKLEPNGTLRSSPKLIPCNQNDFVSISAFINKSLNYTGTAPKLMLKSNASIGYEDLVLATSVSANNTWELLTGITPIATNSGIFEVYIECTGFYGSGSINIDEWDFS